MSFHTNKLVKIVFSEKRMRSCDSFMIVSGYVSPCMVKEFSDFLNEINLTKSVKIVYGMSNSEEISKLVNDNFVKITNTNTNISLVYSNTAVHSKCYVWEKRGRLIAAFIGSANFTRNGLRVDGRECLIDVPKKDFPAMKKYVDVVTNSATPCSNSLKTSDLYFDTNCLTTVNSVTNRTIDTREVCLLPLYSGNGEVPPKHGLNWGLSVGHVSESDACIPIYSKSVQGFPNLFPPKSSSANSPIDMVWDDGISMSGLLEGDSIRKRIKYPKQIGSWPHKKILGEYLRNRLQIAPGIRITRAMLQTYGRDTIGISLKDEIYYLDFHVQKLVF